MFAVGSIFLFGTILGSFLNVCIHRLPRKESIIWPGSHCPDCKCPVPILLNIPLISYLFLLGKCQNCKAKIPIIYPVVEFLTGVLLVLVWQHYGPGLSFLHYGFLMLILLPISFIDLKTKLILNVLTLPGLVIGLLLASISDKISFSQSLMGLLLGGGFLYLIGVVGEFLFKQESMGAGDVKLGAMIGTFLGPQVLIALFLAFFLALPVVTVGLATKRIKLGSTLPFGPFISLGAVVIVCFGNFLYQHYFNIVRTLQ